MSATIASGAEGKMDSGADADLASKKKPSKASCLDECQNIWPYNKHQQTMLCWYLLMNGYVLFSIHGGPSCGGYP